MKQDMSRSSSIKKTCNVAIFVSGSGTNCENIIRYFKDSPFVNISLVLSNKPDAYALVRAEALQVPTTVMPKAIFNDDGELMKTLNDYQIDFIILAGFLLMIPDFLILAYPQRIINIHPALLPKFGGKGMYGHHVHEAVKAAGETETGFTVHWVNGECDGGEIITQYRISLLSSDSVDDIAEKEHLLEMKYFPMVIERVIEQIDMV